MICFGIIEGYWLVRLGDCAPTERHTRDGQRHMNESTQKLGRNDPCPCGSGKKYKKCCLRKQRPGPGRQMRKDMEELIDLSLVPTAEARQQSVEAWTQRSNDTSLTSVDHAWAKVNLAQSLQHQGEHRVRREPCKVLIFSGCNSHPATGSLQPVAIEATRGGNETVGAFETDGSL
jgi:hypothetical protein